jgi:hypothetical protein
MIDLIREDEFVHRVVRDPKDPPDTLFLTGFIGHASRADHTRVYLDVMLSAYVDVPDKSVLHAQPMPPGQSPVGGHFVWIARNEDLVQSVRAARDEMLDVQRTFMNDLDGEPSLSAVAPGWPTIPSWADHE